MTAEIISEGPKIIWFKVIDPGTFNPKIIKPGMKQKTGPKAIGVFFDVVSE